MQKAIRVEILKLLDKEIIYPISNSQSISHVHVVPKKAGFTVVENEKKELMQTHHPMKNRVCIDYCKDHFSLPFIDQTLKRLVRYEYYYFLDGYFGYNQSQLPLKITKKSRSPVHLGRLHTVECHLDYAMPRQHCNIA